MRTRVSGTTNVGGGERDEGDGCGRAGAQSSRGIPIAGQTQKANTATSANIAGARIAESDLRSLEWNPPGTRSGSENIATGLAELGRVWQKPAAAVDANAAAAGSTPRPGASTITSGMIAAERA